MGQQLPLPHLPPTGVAKQVFVTATDVRKPEGNIKMEYVSREWRIILRCILNVVGTCWLI